MKKTRLYLWGASLVMLSSHYATAQSPGGVPVSAWYRSDAPSTLYSDAGSTVATDNSPIQQWNEYLGLGYNLSQANSGLRPIYSNNDVLANFNPTVSFDGSNDWMQFTAPSGVNVIDRATGTIMVAGRMETQKRSGFVGFHPTMDYPGLHVYSGDFKLLFFTGGPGYQGLSDAPMTPNTYFTAGTGWENEAGTSSAYAAATVTLNGTQTEYTGTQLYNANLSTGARDFRIGADNNWGAFSGQLNEIMVYEDRLTPSQMDQVESYMSIKYGSTFAQGTKNYVNSDGVAVWSSTTNNGYHHHIAGIARDDDGALYQKQSWSTNAGKQILIGVGTLANTNAANTATLSDGQFLIWGDNGESKSLSVPTTLFTGISHHFAAIWKVQNTGSVGTVRIAWPKGINNLALIQSTDDIIDATDVVTDMSANEITIGGVVYNYADVVLTDGQYFTLAGKAVAPGGVVDGLVMWHKADDGESSPGPKDLWVDASGNGLDVSQPNDTAYRPTLVTDASLAANSKEFSFNFNPFYYFDGNNDFFYREGDLYFPTINSPGSSYSVSMHSDRGGWNTVFGWADDDPNFARANERYELWRENGRALYTTDIDVRTMPTNIGGMHWQGSGINGVYLNINGQTFSSTSTHIGTLNNNRTPPNFAIGSEGYNLAGVGNERMQGGIAEVFAYSIDHQNSAGDEMQRINSYLAIKYGITLSNDAGDGIADYLSSNSVVVWDATANEGYNNNIAGIAHDLNSGLHQKQSQSQGEGQQILVGTTGLANTNAENTTGIADGQFLLWGDNGQAKVPSVSISGVSDVNFRFASVWKVQNTGSVGTVRIAWPTGLTNLTLIQSTDSNFSTITAATDMSENTTTLNGVAYNYADVTLSDGQYFTLGAQLNGPGGVAADLRVWLRSDAGFSPDEWTDFSGNSNHFTQTNTSRQPFISEDLYNFNPIVDFGTTGADARFMVVPSGQPYTANGANSTLFAATTSRTTSGYTDIFGFGNTTTGAGLINANNPAFTKLNTNVVLYPYTVAPTEFESTRLFKLYLDDVSYTVGSAGIFYGKNGVLDTVVGTVSAANSQTANGAVLGSQAEVRDGMIGELIAYERDITGDEKERVRSYVAIKYGITLAHNYIAANATTIFWDRTANEGYNNNIAGIARDDQGSLYQRQSSSINGGSQVVIGTTGLANSNATNTTGLSNQQFLVWGDNGLSKAPAITISDIDGVNSRFAAVWKAQNTNSVGTVRIAWKAGLQNLILIQSTDTIFNASDIITPMTSIQNINGVDYAYADVTIDDGQYFTFAAFLNAPGGVTHGLSHWYRADKLSVSEGDSTSLTAWTDYTSGVTVERINPHATLPQFVEGDAYNFNFNPGVRFVNTTDMLGNITEQTLTSLDFDMFSVTKNISGSRYFNVGMDNETGNGTNWDQPGLLANGGLQYRNNTGGGLSASGLGGGFAANVPNIAYYEFTNTTATKGLNGGAVSTAHTFSARGAVTGGHIFGSNANTGTELPNGDDGGITGLVGELIIYGNDSINDAQRNKVDAYLAIKYGVTLDTAVSYVTSQDDTIWHNELNAAFYHNVAGIGFDGISALHQKQSRSQHINTNSQVIIGVGDIAATNSENANSLQDGQFLMWGDNGATQSLSTTYVAFEFAGSMDNARRMSRIWKVQNTGVDKQVLIRFPQSSVGTTTLPDETCADYVIIFAPDTSFTTGITVKTLTATDSFYDVMYNFPEGMSYFTYAKARPINSGVVFLPGDFESTASYDDECTTGEWTYFNLEGDISQKLIAFSGYDALDLDSFQINIVPEGALYEDGSQTTKVMPRVTHVQNENNSTLPIDGKVRVYYSQEELDATLVAGASVNGWYKYDGDANEALIDIYSDGVFDTLKAVSLIPDAYGIEDGVNYVEFHNIESYSSFLYVSSTYDESTVLDVTWLYFNARQDQQNVLLEWATGSEHFNKGFEVERSIDGRSWEQIGFVETKAEHGNSSIALNYEFVDQAPHKNSNFYRLKQVDLNARGKYSEIRHVFLGQQSALNIVPNPTTDVITITGFAAGKNQIVLVNSIGQVLMNVSIANQNSYRLDLSRYTAGTYYIAVRNEDGSVNHHKVVKL